VSDPRPNVLLIMADQLPAAALPCYGNPVVRAPNLSALALDGRVFEAAYCASPLCAPSRFAMLTGRLPSAIGAYDNAAELPAATPTVVHLLRAAGYDTVLAGKMHFVGPDQLHGFERRLTTDVYPAAFDWTPDWRRDPGDREGWYHTMTSVHDVGVREAALQTDYDDEVCFQAVRELRHQSVAAGERPFFLTVSFTNPHDPWHVRRRHWDLYAGVDIPRPSVPAPPLEQADPHSRRLREMYAADADAPSPEGLLRARRAYFAAVSYMDELVGQVLSALRETGLAGCTLVLFTADHGELLGERGLWFKMSFLDGSARVPLLAAGPGVAAGASPEPVSQLDLAPTLCELAGVAEPEAKLEGASLAGMLGGGGPAPEVVAGEYLAEGVTAPMVMLRRGRHKFVRCPGDPDQLFDMAADPSELHNVAADPSAADVARALGAECDRRWDMQLLRERVLRSQADRRLVARGLATGDHTPWDFQPHVDASRRFVRGEPAFGGRPEHRYPFSEALTDPPPS